MLHESHIEQTLIDILKAQGYEYHYGPDIAPYSNNPQREGFDSVILKPVLSDALDRLNPNMPLSARTEALQHIMKLGSNDVMTNNEKFHTYLTDGVPVEYFKDGQSKGINVQIIDTNDIENNHFCVVNQFVVKESSPLGERGADKRLDVVVYVNGLPLVLIELKNPTDEDATIDKAFQQIQNYKTAVPSIFYYNALCVISDGLDTRVSTLSAPFSRYLAWKSPDKKENSVVPELQILAERMLKKEVLIKLIRFNTVFESEEVKDSKTGMVSQVKVKKVAAYHQYYAVEKAVNETLRACESLPQLREMPEGQREYGDRKVGVVWHTQGSGKSLSMVFYAGQIVVHPEMRNPTIVVLTDRNDLDDQLFTTFRNCTGLLRQTPVQASSRAHLKELLKVAGGGIIFTTIQKFSPEEGNIYETLSERTNIVVIADEAHRSQYGFAGRIVTDETGSEIRYGNAKYVRDAIPNASFIGFTGTPIEKEDRDTKKVFGEYIDIYDIAQAVRDGATVPISYESRLVKIKMNEGVSEKIDSLIERIDGASEEQKEKAKKRNAQIDAVVGNPERIADIASDIVTHFEARQEAFEGKGMIVCMTRKIAVNLFEEIIKLRPERQSNDLNQGVIKVVMTSSSDDPANFQPHSTTKEDRKKLALRLKDSKDNLKLVIVRDMWLTGFDVPCLHTMYIDKKMQGAALMQAIARVNRVYKDKPGGLIVDYIGIGQDLRNAMAVYTESGGEGQAVVDITEAIAEMKEKFEIVEQMFHGFEYKKYFTVQTGEKLTVLLGAQNFILQSEELKTRFLKETITLSKLFALSLPSDAAIDLKDEIAFFQAIKSRINKFTPSGQKTNAEVETAIKQIVDEALSSGGVIDIFEAAGIKAPSLDILSEEFLLEVKNMQHKNLAFELLKKILNDEVKLRKQRNMVQGKKFSEMLQSVIKRYHNNQIDTARVIEELSEIAREMRIEDHKAEELGLTSQEYAFYMVLAENTSTKFLEEHKMKELIHMIVDIIRKNATVDWEKREDVRAKLRLTVRKVLMRYGYPPDLARLEADRVLEQSELLANEFTKE